ADTSPNQIAGATIQSPGLGNEPMNAVSNLSSISKSEGEIIAITVTNGGTGYTSAPTVSITGGGGTGATAVAILSGDEVSEVIITNPGSGYTSAPTISFTGDGT